MDRDGFGPSRPASIGIYSFLYSKNRKGWLC